MRWGGQSKKGIEQKERNLEKYFEKISTKKSGIKVWP